MRGTSFFKKEKVFYGVVAVVAPPTANALDEARTLPVQDPENEMGSASSPTAAFALPARSMVARCDASDDALRADCHIAVSAEAQS